MRSLYAVLSIVGFVLPYWWFIAFLREHGLVMSLFLSEMFANNIASFFAVDVVLSAIVLIVFILLEGRRLAMRRLWVYIVATLGVGVSLGLPLFLFAREGVLRASSSSAV